MTIDRPRPTERQVHLFLRQGNEINAAALFPFLPLGIVDGGAVVGVDDLATDGGVVAQRGQIETLEGMHVVLLFALSVREVVERLRAHIPGEEMTDRAFAALERHVVHGGSVPVPVGGVEVKASQALQMRERIVDQQSRDLGAGLLAKRQTTLAFERLEKMAALGALRPLRANLLEECAPADLIMQCPHRAQG